MYQFMASASNEDGNHRGWYQLWFARLHCYLIHSLSLYSDVRGTERDVCVSHVTTKQWIKEQASRCCTADVCLHQSVNHLYNNQKMAKLVLFSAACSRLASIHWQEWSVQSHYHSLARILQRRKGTALSSQNWRPPMSRHDKAHFEMIHMGKTSGVINYVWLHKAHFIRERKHATSSNDL